MRRCGVRVLFWCFLTVGVLGALYCLAIGLLRW